MTWVDQEFASGFADWSAFNGSANTFADVTDGCLFVRWDDAAHGGGNLSGFEIPIGAASNWVRLVKFQALSGYFDGSIAGFGVRDSVGGKCLLIGQSPGGPFDSAYVHVSQIPAALNSRTLVGSARLLPSSGVGGTRLARFLKIKHDGSLLRFSWSEDGQTFGELRTEAPTAYLDNAPDRLILALYQTTGQIAMAVDYVRDAETAAAASAGIKVLEGGGLS